MASTHIDGALFRRMVQAATAALENGKEVVNALNVFPVPDGDTGSNMSLTMTSARREVERTTDSHCGQLAQALAQGSLMGARGNSGVILSQLFRGFARYVAERAQLSPRELALAFEEGVETAYKAVMKPVEGTILTVAREAAAAAVQAARKERATVAAVLAAALRGAEAALARTPDLLPVLKRAGVVDAGGKGYTLILQGYLESVGGQASGTMAPAAGPDAAPAATPAAPPAATPAATPGAAAPAMAGQAAVPHDTSPATRVEFQVDEEIAHIEFPYDTEFFIRGAGIPLDTVRARLEEMGDCVYVVGSPELAKVHIHTANPGPVLDYCIGHGDLIQIEIHNMREQHADLMARAGGAAPAAGAPVQAAGQPTQAMAAPAPTDVAEPPPASGVVAVAAGPGQEAILRSLGAAGIVPGGQSMNPSTQDIYQAIEACPSGTVYLLPNNKNIILAAEQAAALSGKQVHVIPSRSLPQGIAALLAWQPDGEPEKVAGQMTRALAAVETGEVTYAVRDTTLGDMQIQAGDILGLWNGDIVVTGSQDPESAVQSLLAQMVNRVGGEVITLYTGADADAAAAERLGEELRAQYPDHEIEVHAGGQPLYYYVLSVE